MKNKLIRIILGLVILKAFSYAIVFVSDETTLMLQSVNKQTVLRINYHDCVEGATFRNPLVSKVDSSFSKRPTIINKIILSDEECGFYNMLFRDGVLVRDKTGKIYGTVLTKNIEELEKEKTFLNWYPAREFRVGTMKESTVGITLNAVIEATRIQDIVMIYGVNNAGINPLDIYSGYSAFMDIFSSPSQTHTTQQSCVILYLPVKGIKRVENNTYLIIDQNRITSEYLGDGLIVAPLIPLANFNGQKTKQSLFDRFTK